MQLFWQRRASADADAIADYIALDNPLAALEVRERIEQTVRILLDHPLMGRAGRVRSTRELVVSGLPYIVIYRIKNKIITVLRILHGAQQWPKHS